ncbi:ABC transporter ATP-binding protein [Microbacterium rhizophilus]|uniref:ABC transporter ATP-binding protein n=1 Tax=Microbacterium rhizophilus TaxID=3138934 RepID=UPI0031ED157B
MTSRGHASDAPQTSFASSLLRLHPFARAIVPRLVLGLVTAALASMVALSIPQVLQWIVNGPLFDADDASGLWWGVAIVLALGVLETALLTARRQLVLAPGTKLEADLRVRLYEHLAQLPVGFHDEWGSGQLLSRSFSDIRRFRRWLSFGMIMICVNAITIVTGLILMFAASPALGAVYLVAAIPVVIVSFRFRRRYRILSRHSQDLVGDLATVIEESVRGIRILKAFGRARQAGDDFHARADRVREVELQKSRALSTVSMVLALLPETGLSIALGLGITLVAQGALSVGAVVAFFATASLVNGPLGRLGEQFAMSMDAKTAIDRYFEVLDVEDTILDPAEPAEPGRGADLVFEGVRFAYPDAVDGREVLEGVDLRIEPGETMALVGVTGSGKSTLVELVPRFHDVTGGSVRIGGVDVRDLARHELRGLVAIAFEEPVLFSSTVRDNILLGVPDAGDDVLEEAIDVAGAEFVRDLPHGVDTQIGEEGLSLSGGQRQRVALARAIAAHPRILVLDDPLSALDVRTEARVTERLRETLAGTTTLVVAHRPSTVALADRVALLDEGRIVAVGTHERMLADEPRYRAVIARQSGEHLDDALEAAGAGREEAMR